MNPRVINTNPRVTNMNPRTACFTPLKAFSCSSWMARLLSAALLGLAGLALSGCSDSSSGSSSSDIQPLPERTSTHYIEQRYVTRGQDHRLIEDTHTGLVWLRCALGQEWDATSGHCIGRVTPKNHAEVRQALQSHRIDPEHPGLSGFRLPSRDELLTLVHCPDQPLTAANIGSGECSDVDEQPTLATEVFPDTEAATHWSSTPMSEVGRTYYGVNFGSGQLSRYNSPNSRYPVRLVRALSD